MLAGGGVKIAFQAGVLQVWLDEAGLKFDHADAVSAACFNLAMWTQGMTGTRIADNWRNVDPLSEVDIDFRDLAKLLYAKSLFTLDAFRQRVFPAWGIDFKQLRASTREATFNIYNFSKHELTPVEAHELTEDHLAAAGSLPVWFPPVTIDGDTYIDAIFNTPCNVEEAIRRGSDELWIIWTTSERGEWFNGFVGNFFGIFEAATVHAYKQSLARIDHNNQAIREGKPGEYGRAITVRELKAEVPVHYLFNFSKDRAAEAVNRGVEAARAWCDANSIARRPGPVYATKDFSAHTASLHFREDLSGPGLSLHLEIYIDDLDRFLTLPEHAARVQGNVVSELLGGTLPVIDGTMNLLVDDGDPAKKQIRFRLTVADVVLLTVRQLDPSSHSSSTEVTIERGSAVIGNGTVQSGTLDVLKQLASIRVNTPTLAESTSALGRFGAFYFGHLWDVYARHVLPSAPF